MNPKPDEPDAAMAEEERRDLTWDETKSILALLRAGHPTGRIVELTGIRPSAVRAVATALLQDLDD
ncbi:hypothetical protein FFK22_018775 [Mycobacterium sp. KBS0706]|uniref:hypothetical protein n=1 Tax=Mycobacterium sp. KBS0706 TaxID=2578109 RepID=UPI00110FB64B|nr:hypothetical protein [Mycobacterium sp. KBS0706]TSD87096.1 hypothetical protein FFK22_018775 [Mycobacterium sp. KBS0706]